jgi:hypothetical protein
VGPASLVLEGRAGREDAQLAIDLHAVGVDDDAIELLGQPQRQPGLAARRRPGDQDGAFIAWLGHAHN